jgi:hypothetical protein
MVLHGHCETGTTLVEDIPEIYQRWRKSDSINRKHCEYVELDGQYLVGTDYFNGYFHSELFVFVLGRRLLVLLDQVLLAVREDGAVGAELQPDVEGSLALDVTQSRVELQVLLEAAGEEELQLHGLGTSVMKDDFFTIELFVH